MSTSLTIVRHGDTFAPGEPPRRIGVRTDLPLAASGEAQARALGAAFARDGVRFDRVLVAPLRRTWATAALVLEQLPAPLPPPVRCDWLREIDHGPDEGEPEARVVARVGADALARWDRELIAPPGWVVDAPARVTAWRALLDSAAEQVLLVTSNGAARFVFAACPALAAQARALPSTRLRTGAWGRLVREASGWRVRAWDVRG